MKKILMVIDSLGHGGAQRQFVGLAAGLKERGYDVCVLYYHDITFYKDFLDKNRVTNRLVAKGEKALNRARILRNAIKDYNPDVVISFLGIPGILTSIIRKSGVKFKLIVSERNITTALNIRERLKFIAYKAADLVVSNSYTQTEYIKSNHKGLSTKCLTITNFTDLHNFHPNKEKYGRRNEIPLITVAASTIPSKNAMSLIRAAKLVKDNGIRFIINWYGETQADKTYADLCRAEISRLGLEENFHILPRNKNIDEIYRNSDYFCLPSFYEGTPNALCEAIASGLPALVSNVSDNHRFVNEGSNGFLIDNPRDIHEIADKLTALLSISDEEYRLFSMQSRSKAEKTLSFDRFMSEYINII